MQSSMDGKIQHGVSNGMKIFWSQCNFLKTFCDNVWTLMLNDVEFRDFPELTKVDRVKIVAIDTRAVSIPARAEDN